MRRALLPTLALAVAAGCAPTPRLYADRAWVRLAAVPGAPAAAYLTVHGGERTATVTGIDSPMARRAEMHETMTQAMGGTAGGAAMSTMRPLAAVAVPAAGVARFAPEGRHVMLFDVAAGVKPGGMMPLTLHYRDAPDERIEARVIAAGDPAP